MFQFDRKVDGGKILKYINSKTLANPGNSGVDPSVGLTGYRLCDELNKQLRVCAGQRGWNTNFKQKENNLKKAANDISKKLASFSLSFRINFVALMLSVPLLSHRRGQVLLFSIWGPSYGGTQDPFLL